MSRPIATPMRCFAVVTWLALAACGGGGGDGGSPSNVSANDPNAPTVVAGPNGSTIVTNPPAAGTGTTTAPPAGGTLIIPPATNTQGTGSTSTNASAIAEAAASRLLPLLFVVPVSQYSVLRSSIDGDMMVEGASKACASGGTVSVAPFDANDKVVARADSADVDFAQCGYDTQSARTRISGIGIWGILSASRTTSQSAVRNLYVMLNTDYAITSATNTTLSVKSGVTAAMILDIRASADGSGEMAWSMPTAGAQTTWTVSDQGNVSTITLSDLVMTATVTASGTTTFAVVQGAYKIASPAANGSGNFAPRTIAVAPNDQKLMSQVLRAQ